MATENKLNYCSLFCGVLLFENYSFGTQFSPWGDRLNDRSDFTDRFNRNYYANFAANILIEGQSPEGLHHVTSRQLLLNPAQFSIVNNGTTIRLESSYLDLFLFGEGVGIFAFKVEFHPDEEITYEKISATLNQVRNPLAFLDYDGKKLSVLRFIQQFLEPAVHLKSNWASNIPQLKTFTLVEDSTVSSFTESLDQRLFELSHIMPAGSFLNSEYSPSKEYYEHIQKENTISLYANWKAITLFDSFTRISSSFPDRFHSWELEYFLIYVHCLYTKFQLYQFNSQLKDVALISAQSSRLRRKFIEFINDYNLAYISYKFLPNFLFEKINHSIEIQKELDRMEQKISRLNEAYQEQKSKQTNGILLVLSLLSVVSVITDFSQWLGLVGLPPGFIYSPVVAIGIWLSIGLMALWFIKRSGSFD